ncbi:MAG: LysM peptidoglycan-binding domain-containing protein, partial [Gemmatimonadaceae bacterium]
LAAAGVSRDSGDVAPHEVVREAVSLFGDTAAAPVADTASASEAPTWDIDVRSYETHSRVEFYIQRFQGGARSHFAGWLARGGRYEPMIRSKLRAAGLPEDITYLALIESGYDVHAYSRAAAVGMWQFMTTTARGTGLRVDWWVDERRDPVRSTDAAIKFLGWLKDQFGSLYLAAAAYNGGPGRISRGLRRYADELEGTSGEDVFFALAETDYLRAETRDYVPKLIAAALVAKAPARYGFNVRYLPPLAYDSVRVGAATPLAAVARASGSSNAEILDLNPQVLRGVTPPRDSLTLRVPVGRAAGFRAAYAALPDSERVAFRRVTTKRGDTRASLARRGGITTAQLARYNRGLRASSRGAVTAGQTVLLPSRPVIALALDVPDPAVERYGSASRSTHVVKRGESLGLIARRYRTSVAQLKRLNGLRRSVIYPGQVIVVRRGAAASRRPRRSSSSSSASVRPSVRTVCAPPCAATAAASTPRTHVVRRGESLYTIARKYDLTVDALKELNGLRGDAIRAGQSLAIR